MATSDLTREQLAAIGRLLEGLVARCPPAHRERPRAALLVGIPRDKEGEIAAIAETVAAAAGRVPIRIDLREIQSEGLICDCHDKLVDRLTGVDLAGPSLAVVVGFEVFDPDRMLDAGIGQRLLGSFARWRADRGPDSIVVALVDDPARLPREFARSRLFPIVMTVDDRRSAL